MKLQSFELGFHFTNAVKFVKLTVKCKNKVAAIKKAMEFLQKRYSESNFFDYLKAIDIKELDFNI